jgi:glycosyltransferase involved in cell wall biosynthesis
MKISATILTKNSQKHITAVLESLSWCDEVVVLDTGSTDKTMEIATGFANVALYIHNESFFGFGKMHQKATSLAKNDMILSIDSDEIVSAELREEIKSLDFDPHAVYFIPSHNYFNGKIITTCGWSPDYKARLYDRRFTDFDDREVHENLRFEGMKKIYLKHHLLHYSFNCIGDFLRKIDSYSTLFAVQNTGKKEVSMFSAIGHCVWAFLKSFILKRGFLQCPEGFIISIYNAQSAFWKYTKLYEANKKLEYSK